MVNIMEKIPDITKLKWQLNISILGAIFSIFALIYNTQFIYYGFLTFAYGVISLTLISPIEELSSDKWKYWNFLIVQLLLTLLWLISCVILYK